MVTLLLRHEDCWSVLLSLTKVARGWQLLIICYVCANKTVVMPSGDGVNLFYSYLELIA